jgi:hypothetical protein
MLQCTSEGHDVRVVVLHDEPAVAALDHHERAHLLLPFATHTVSPVNELIVLTTVVTATSSVAKRTSVDAGVSVTLLRKVG